MTLLVSLNILTTAGTLSSVLVVRLIEHKTVRLVKFGVFALKIGRIKLNKNEDLQRCYLIRCQNIDNMYDFVDFLKRIDNSWYFIKRFSCASY